MTAVATTSSLAAAVDTLAEELDQWHAPAVQLAVVDKGAVAYAGGVGVRGVADPTPVSPTTLFHHGSCGKAYTALLAAALAADGVLDLDAPVRRLVPELELADPVIAERVTVRDLLSHRSGLARHDLLWILSPSLTREELVGRLAALPVGGDLRAEMAYSNLGYTLAGLAIGRAAGTTYEDALAQRILEPCGLTRTGATAAASLADPDHARAHLLRDGVPVETAYRMLDGTAPAGQLRTSAEDAARWLIVQTCAGVVEGREVVPASAVSETHRLHVPMPPELAPFPELGLVGYDLGWVHSTYRGRPALWHTGGVDGFFTYALLLPDQRIGVLASVNLHMCEIARAAVHDIADAMLGEPSVPSWYDRLHAETEASTPPPRAPQSPQDRHTHNLAAYAGTYRDAGYGDVVVGVVDGELRVRIGESDVTALHRLHDTWNLHYAPLELDLPVTFVTDADGLVAEAVVPLEPTCGVTRFRRVDIGTT
jgi:CubicO group peptidase (beta-lactamase class C family)